MRYKGHPNRYWRVGLSLLLITFVFSVSLPGCSKTDKGESPKKSEAPAVAKPQVDDGKPFSFRGITMGVPLKTQFKDCKSQPGGICYKEGVKGEAFKGYQIEGLPKLDFGTKEYVSLIDDSVELILVEFVKEYASTNMMKLLKETYGEPASSKSSMLAEKATDLPYEKFLVTWNIKGCVLELSNVRDSIVDSGRVLIKSEKYLKKEAQGGGKK
ncbi:MAG: hypothetical protein NTX62_02240 [Deltaproteobacteria bacterium]|nr:hypothetical protein [Deltaproteobacteria bacterium]